MQLTPNEGYLRLLNIIRTDLNVNGTLRLYQNPATIDDDTVLVELTEANFGGYAPQNPNNFGGAALQAPQLAFIKNQTFTFTCDGTGAANTVYGAYVEHATGVLIAVLEFNAPLLVNTAGQTVVISLALFAGPQPAV